MEKTSSIYEHDSVVTERNDYFDDLETSRNQRKEEERVVNVASASLVNNYVKVATQFLSEDTKKVVYACVKAHTEPKGFFEKCKNILFRIKEAVLSIFGFAHHQVAMKALHGDLQQTIESILKTGLNKFTDNKSKGLTIVMFELMRPHYEGPLYKYVSKLSQVYLQALFTLNGIKHQMTEEEIMNEAMDLYGSFNLENIMAKMPNFGSGIHLINELNQNNFKRNENNFECNENNFEELKEDSIENNENNSYENDDNNNNNQNVTIKKIKK